MPPPPTARARTLVYSAPPTVRKFMRHYLPGQLFYSWIIGPLGSGKTTGLFFKLVYMAQMQAKSADGIRRSKAVIVRNTMPQLKDTTIASWMYWFKDGEAGTWHETNKSFTLRFADVECEVLFRALDTPADVARVLSLEVTFAIFDEFVQIPRAIIDALSGRCGRYPTAAEGAPATNWGMWGASNPSTEDNWWFTMLHEELPENAIYLLQPSGFSPEAENIENLPGGREYYTNQAKGKTQAWIMQFLEAQWGFSVDGRPVVPSFRPDLHVAPSAIRYEPLLPLVAGFDPGLTGSAMIFGQQDLNGQLRVLGELVQEGYSAVRFLNERMRPYLSMRFPGLRHDDLTVAPDPAAGSGQAATDDRVVDILRRHYRVSIESNNRLPLRLDAIEHFTSRLTQAGPALLIDPVNCPILIRALKGGWRFTMDRKREEPRPVPEKNPYSHPGDGFGYLARHFHRQGERTMRYRDPTAIRRQAPVNVYHMR